MRMEIVKKKKVGVGGTIMVKAFFETPNLQLSVLPNAMGLLGLGCVETKGKHHPGGSKDDKKAEADHRLPMRSPMQVLSGVVNQCNAFGEARFKPKFYEEA